MRKHSPKKMPKIKHNELNGDYTYEVNVVINGIKGKGYMDVVTKIWYIQLDPLKDWFKEVETNLIDYRYYT